MVNTYLEDIHEFLRCDLKKIETYLSTNRAAFPAREGSNLDPVSHELLEKSKDPIDYFDVEDVVSEEEGSGRL